MPIKRPELENDEIYHIIARGVDGRLIFNDKSDYYRAIHDLFEFNDIKPAPEHSGFKVKSAKDLPEQSAEDRPPQITSNKQPRELLVELLAFCLMPNHIHLLIRQLHDDGISKFMKKFGTGYAVYFNQKNERQGHLFQGRFRAVHIKTDAQLKAVFTYIHANPVVLVEPGWKDGSVKFPKKAIEFMENYKWSSYQDYLGKKNFPSLTQREFFNGIMPVAEWREFVNDWVSQKKEVVGLDEVALE